MKSNRKPIFFTSDWHIGHANSIVFDDRPFKDLDHMHQVLINNYNAVVPEDGICYHLGDVGMSNVETLSGVLSQLNGTKVCILGNHDGNVNRMYKLGFDVVLYGATLYIAGEEVTLTHCPLRGIFREDITGMRGAVDGDLWHGESKQIRFSTENRGQFHLCGHTHKSKNDMILHRQWDIGVVGNDFRPVSISKVESWISKTKTIESKLTDIEGYSGYKINIFGEVYSFKRYPEGRLLTKHLDKDGYYYVSMMKDGKNKKEKLHRLVAKAFIKNENNLPQVNHKNGVKKDFSISNLEWVSNMSNQRHAWDSDLKTIKLTTQDVKCIKIRILNGESNTEIAKDYNIDTSSVSNIRTGRTWNRILIND